MKSYVKSLDTLRAIAVSFVVYYHWVEGGVTKIISWGPVGVEMFFTLSGFLITSILLNGREKIDLGHQSGRWTFKQFYLRRILRIFPIYYLYVAIVFLLSAYFFSYIRSTILWYLTYTQNILFYKTDHFDGILSHLWSLAVEEQFYLFWPALILILPRKILPWAMAVITLTGIISQHLYYPPNAGPILTYQCMDCFGMGGLLAYFMLPSNRSRVTTFLVFIAVAAFILLGLNIFFDFYFIGRRTFVAVITTVLIFWLITRQGTKNYLWKYFWENPLFTFIGRISYGIYMYHILLFYSMIKILSFNYDDPYEKIFGIMKNPIFFLSFYALLIIISWVSYALIEKRFLNLKKKII